MPPLGIYVHVPFCASRCGYCDFNTYIPDGQEQQDQFVAAALTEILAARAELGDRSVDTVFFGGGTPTLLGARSLLRLLDGISSSFTLAADAETTTEANPESVDLKLLRELRRAGFNRISLGMQSATPHVLRTLDRRHSPGRAVLAAGWCQDAAFQHVSLDLIYGAPGETDQEWQDSLDAVIDTGVDHLSAYALAVKPGTALAVKVRGGTLPAPDELVQSRRYLIADERLASAGFDWYELCSWATDESARCRHNQGYWRSDDWWGIGPGAYSHVDGVRWSNVRLPAVYAKRLSDGDSPAIERETLSAEQRKLERIMLGLRTSEGVAVADLSVEGQEAAAQEAAAGHVEFVGDHVALTRDGRLLADHVTSALTA